MTHPSRRQGKSPNRARVASYKRNRVPDVVEVKLSSKCHADTANNGNGSEDDVSLLREFDGSRRGLIFIPAMFQTTKLSVLLLPQNAIRRIRHLPPTLVSLDLSHNNIESMEGLSECPQLRRVYLHHNKIKEITGLSGTPELEELWLGANNISGVPPLKHLRHLHTIDLSSNSILTAMDVASLRHNPSLAVISLANNPLTSHGDAFGETRAMLPDVEVIDFTGLDVSDPSSTATSAPTPFTVRKGKYRKESVSTPSTVVSSRSHVPSATSRHLSHIANARHPHQSFPYTRSPPHTRSPPNTRSPPRNRSPPLF
eukprot:Rmarinus@m.15472